MARPEGGQEVGAGPIASVARPMRDPRVGRTLRGQIGRVSKARGAKMLTFKLLIVLILLAATILTPLLADDGAGDRAGGWAR